jgi:hypothetical protein
MTNDSKSILTQLDILGSPLAFRLRDLCVAALEWTGDRVLNGPDEERMFAAIYRLFPLEFGKENCSCGEQDDCEECLSRAAIERRVKVVEARRAALTKEADNE